MVAGELLVSVIIPVFNVENYINNCIDSVLKQTYKKIEVILIDDGSTDKSGMICDFYKQKDKRVKVYHRSNHGLVSSWKFGVNKATGADIVFIDSDDLIEPNHISSLKEAKDKYKVEMVFSPVSRYLSGEKKERKFKIYPGKYSGKKYMDKILSHFLSTGKLQSRLLPPNRWGKIFSKKIIQKNMKYSNEKMTYGEDLSLIYPILMDLNSVYILSRDNNSYLYRIRSNSMIEGYDKNRWASVKIVYDNLFRAYSEKKSLVVIKNQLNLDIYSALVQTYKNEIKNPNFSLSSFDVIVRDMKRKINEWRLSRKPDMQLGPVDALILSNIIKGNKLSNHLLSKNLQVLYRLKLMVKRGD